jgi:hypothetical protein
VSRQQGVQQTVLWLKPQSNLSGCAFSISRAWKCRCMMTALHGAGALVPLEHILGFGAVRHWCSAGAWLETSARRGASKQRLCVVACVPQVVVAGPPGTCWRR